MISRACGNSDTPNYEILNDFVCVDALSPSQQFFSHAGTISFLPGLN